MIGKGRKKLQDIFLSVLGEGCGEAFGEGIVHLSSADWEVLYNFGRRLGLLSAFYIRLSKRKIENIPDGFLQALKYSYIQNLQRGVMLERELFKTLDYLKRELIPTIPLKGPILARFLYGDIAMRPAGSDLDILVPRERVEEAEKKLAEMGYGFYPSLQTADFFHRFREQLTLRKKTQGDDGVLLDLHWGLRDRFTTTHLKEMWHGASEVHLNGARVLFPSNEDLLLYLALAAVSDFDFVQVRYLYDIHTLATNLGAKLDWETAAVKAKRSGLATAVFFALKLSRKLFGTAIPEDMSMRIRPSLIKRIFLEVYINTRNVLGPRTQIASSYMWRNFVSCFALSKNIFAAFKIIIKKIFLPFEEVAGNHGLRYRKGARFLYIKRLLSPIVAINYNKERKKKK